MKHFLQISTCIITREMKEATLDHLFLKRIINKLYFTYLKFGPKNMKTGLELISEDMAILKFVSA